MKTAANKKEKQKINLTERTETDSGVEPFAIMQQRRKTDLTFGVMVAIVLLFHVHNSSSSDKTWSCKERVIKKFLRKYGSGPNIFISQVHFAQTAIAVQVDCDKLNTNRIRFDKPFVNVVVDCHQENMKVVDELLYGNYNSSVPLDDTVLDKPFFNILLIANSSLRHFSYRQWFDARRNIYTLQLASIKAIYNGIQVACKSATTNFPGNNEHNWLTSTVDFQGRTLKVGVADYQPFSFEVKHENSTLSFNGFCIELLRALSISLNFTYDISTVSPMGYKDKFGTWHGGVGDLTKKKLDLMVTGMSITAQRSEVIDFTYPFWEEPTGILMRTAPKNTFVIARPLRSNVWLVFISAIVVSAYIAFCFEIFTFLPFERKRKPFTLWKSLWYAAGAAVLQGSKIQPERKKAGGILLAFQYVAVIIMVSYSAKLASNLTLKEIYVPFETLQDLVEDSEHVIYMNDGAAHRTLLEDSDPSTVYGKLWKKAHLLKSSSYAGIQKALVENKAGVVMTDQTSLIVQAVLTQQCNWAILKEEFFKTNFGVGLPKHSPFTDVFSSLILKYQTAGLIQIWEKIHVDPWRQKCETNYIFADSKSMKMQDMWLTWVVLAVGAFLSFILLTGEQIVCKIKCLSSKSKEENKCCINLCIKR